MTLNIHPIITLVLVILITLINKRYIDHSTVKFNGYEPNQTQTSHYAQQEFAEPAMTKYEKLPNIEEGVPILSGESIKLWARYLEMNIKTINEDVGKYIFDNPAKQATADMKTKAALTETEADFLDFKSKYKAKVDNQALLKH